MKRFGDDFAKSGRFQDTPDDLLKKLEDSDRFDAEAIGSKLSELAVEHAARRVGLIKKSSVSESAIKNRQKGISSHWLHKHAAF